jgi:uncharacterized protein YdhG (YjbR/CyaY superfamily)
MSELFRKLNLGDHRAIQVLNAPDSLSVELAKLEGVEVKRTLRGATDFVLAFAITRKELDEVCRRLVQAASDDAVVWVAYPKGTSKRYKGEFNRDTGWDVFGEAGYEPVRQVSLDEDWSALRFSKAERIGKMTRSRAISEAGKKRIVTGNAAAKTEAPKSGRASFSIHEEYFAAHPAEVRSLLEWIQKTTENVVPGAERCVSYGMPAFRARKMFLYFAAFKQHIGIYPPLRGNADLIRELEPYRGPKGNLSFPFSAPFPKALVKRVVIALAAEHGGGGK